MTAGQDIADWLFEHELKPLDDDTAGRLIEACYAAIDAHTHREDCELMQKMRSILVVPRVAPKNETEGKAE